MLRATLGLAASSSALGQSPLISPVDHQAPPPAERQFVAADGHHRLTLSAVEPTWREPTVWARLERLRNAGSASTVLWHRRLPQPYGPRFAVVGRHGHVLLVDTWILTPSRDTLQWLHADGTREQHWSFDDVAQRLGVSRNALSSAANDGTWVARAPQLDAAGRWVRIGAGGRMLVVDLTNGQLGTDD